jgi:hypothetical protein
METSENGALVVNFFGGPGGGKTTAATQLFVALKLRNADAELHYELARQFITQGQLSALDVQPYLFGLALYKLIQTAKNTDIVIMDSPLLLNPIYDKWQSSAFRMLTLEEHRKFRNLNVWVNRPAVTGHSMTGRVHDYAESLLLDQRIREFLKDEDIPHIELTPTPENVALLADRVIADVEAHRSQLLLLDVRDPNLNR